MPTILLADDDESLRSLLAGELRRYGWKVLEFGDGAEALRAAIASPPDLVLADVSLPGMDGYSVCRVLRENPRTSRIPVLLMSGGPSDELQRLEYSPDDWISKPFRLTDVIRKAEAMLRPTYAAEERCAECGAAIAAGSGRFRQDKTVCTRCHDAGLGQ